MLPDDLKLITLRFGNDCGACGTQLTAGDRAYWSPAARGQAWCERCVREPGELGADRGDAGDHRTDFDRPKRTEPPAELRLITLRYDSHCTVCGKKLQVGDRAYWSPAVRGRAWCEECGQIRGTDTTDEDGARDKRRHRPSRPQPSAPPASQDPWSRLCRYLGRCVLAESANTLLAFQDLGTKGFLHDLELEHLVTGSQDWTPVPARLAGHLATQDTKSRDVAFNYGWPALVGRNQKNRPVVAPLFQVTVHVEQHDGQWIGAAQTEPEFNSSIVAGELFDMSAREVVEAIVGDGLPFGDADALARLAEHIAEALDVPTVCDLDPQALGRQIDAVPGMYNAAIWMPADDDRGASRFLLEELDLLARRTDWSETAAAFLVGERPRNATRGRASSKTPLAGPLPCNGSQESILDRIRREALTMVTGPPGTGKTQLVVNAVTNAWLDGETVLVASTNNGAVDVAVERANGDIGCGMLLRTGNRKAREALADRVVEAVGVASAADETSKGQRGNAGSAAAAHAELAETAARRAGLLADLAAAAELSRKLAETVDDLERLARGLWRQDRAPDIPISSGAVERRALRVRRAWFFRRRRIRRLLAVVRCGQADTSLDDLARWAALDQSRTALMEELAATEARIGDPATSLQRANDDWAAASMTVARYAIRAGFKEGEQALRALARAGLGGASLPKAIRDSFRHARGWACTALSMQRSFRLERGLFDLVIIDEASQCSLATALPLAYRAKRLAVIGDPNQLTPVITLPDALLRKMAASERFDDDDLARRGAHYKEGSAYLAFAHALEGDSQQPIVLDEHYRCHPHIARWFNREFYQDTLTVLTDVARMPPDQRSIGWIDVSGETARGPAASWTNTAEAERAVQEITAVFGYRVESRKSVQWCAASGRMGRYMEHGERGRRARRFEGAPARAGFAGQAHRGASAGERQADRRFGPRHPRPGSHHPRSRPVEATQRRPQKTAR